MNLFVYGTLMCDDIMQEVSGISLAHEPAILAGYIRRSVKGEQYPAVVYEKTGRVEGVVYRAIPGPALNRLDRFEGDMYYRKEVEIKLSNGLILSAETYVVKPEFLNLLEAAEWDFKNFLRNGKSRFQKHYKGYGCL